MTGLAAEAADEKTIMIDVEPGPRHWFERPGEGYLKAHRTASSLRVSSADQKTVRGTVFPTDGGVAG